jgi:hypothetical protein
VDQLAMVRMLEDALDRLGVTLRVEAMPEESRLDGGMCVVHGQRAVFVSPRASLADRIQILGEALRHLDTESIWLPPAIREQILDNR